MLTAASFMFWRSSLLDLSLLYLRATGNWFVAHTSLASGHGEYNDLPNETTLTSLFIFDVINHYN